MATTDVILTLAKVFIMILPGYVLSKMNILNENHTVGMSNLITYVTYPCMVICAMQLEFSWEILNNCKYVVLVFLGVVIVAMILSKILTTVIRLPSSQSGIMAFMMVFGNTGFLGLPVLNGLFGKEAVFYGALCDSSVDLLIFSLGVTLIRQAAKGDERMGLGETLKGIINPCFVCVIIGLVLYVLQITLPDIISGPLDMLGSATSPLAMMVVGAHLGRISFREMFMSKPSYLVCLLKLLVAPAVALIFVKLLVGSGTIFGTVIVIEAAMPCAMLSVILSEYYKADVEFATKGVMLTTILSLITIPVVAIVLQLI
ncbi:MAG: AEC family transporter [Clostridia bacterium]|nr:AEC family transporter [Clostridia bacterium]